MALVYFLINAICLLSLGIFSLKNMENAEVYYISFSMVVGAGIASLVALTLEFKLPNPLVKRKGDKLRAVYVPRLRNVSEKAETLVGRETIWEAVWKIDQGEYKGSWAMSPINQSEGIWVPLPHLIVQDRRK